MRSHPRCLLCDICFLPRPNVLHTNVPISRHKKPPPGPDVKSAFPEQGGARVVGIRDLDLLGTKQMATGGSNFIW